MQLPFVWRKEYDRAVAERNAAQRAFNMRQDTVAQIMRKLHRWQRETTANLFNSHDALLRGRTYAAIQELSKIIGQ